MILEKSKEKIKSFFEEYYSLVEQEDADFLQRYNVAKEMLDGDVDKDGYGKWKLIESNIEKEEIDLLEEELKIKIPDIFKCFLTTYFHYFNEFVGESPADNHFAEIKRNKIPCLLRNDFLPFCWDNDDTFIFCADTGSEDCPIYKIDHDIVYALDGQIEKNELKGYMEMIAKNLNDYLDMIVVRKKLKIE